MTSDSRANTLVMRRAGPDDFPVVMGLLEESIAWLRSKGLDQWSTWPQWRAKMVPSLEHGDVWLLCDGTALIATITVELHGDPDFWTDEERGERAAYVSKLAVRRDRSGAELGTQMLDWASDYAYRCGCRWLRLDAWKTNEQLHDYYRQRGWTHVRTVDKVNRRSGALFQRPARLAGRTTLTQGDDTVTIFPTQLQGNGLMGANASGSWVPNHMHRADQLQVDYQYTGASGALFVPGYRYRVRQAETGWVLETDQPGRGWVVEGPVVAGTGHFAEECEYIFTHRDGEPCTVEVSPVPSARGASR
ncbi:GNAT family N-acetyltransferase [Dactylosporangium roseum]|uniref:GNAT family N-acetyltransferase n=1 Tax=Dactylosporangium roseum TaxID=47989 RepID=A0ABY5Z535_9ACTN|nr:GNAT family N-acetyltransferase [Dactylosporangium roseum]UWZ36120.1 GNAT family N-acetyltransferase [Dactylosporangium roseum]